MKIKRLWYAFWMERGFYKERKNKYIAMRERICVSEYKNQYPLTQKERYNSNDTIQEIRNTINNNLKK